MYTKVCVGSGTQDGIEEIFEGQWFKHPDFESDKNESTLSDIALIRLREPFTKHSTDGTHYTINTICLPDNNRVNINFEQATFFGFGDTDNSINSETANG